MASLDSTITVTTSEYRTCFVNGRKALFHRWSVIAETVSPSPLKGGHPGGQLMQTFGIVEFEDGIVKNCLPSQIRFCDNIFAEYPFPKEDE